MKTAKKTFIAVSMIGFVAMMFSCAGTKKDAPVPEESASVQRELDDSLQPEAPAETPVEEKSLSEQDALQGENPSAVQEELPQNNDASVSTAE